jgi:hypothetical protein
MARVFSQIRAKFAQIAPIWTGGEKNFSPPIATVPARPCAPSALSILVFCVQMQLIYYAPVVRSHRTRRIVVVQRAESLKPA